MELLASSWASKQITHSDGLLAQDRVEGTATKANGMTANYLPASFYLPFISEQSKRRKPNASTCFGPLVRSVCLRVEWHSPEPLPSREEAWSHLSPRWQTQPSHLSHHQHRSDRPRTTRRRRQQRHGRRDSGHIGTTTSCRAAIWADGWLRAIPAVD